MKSRPTIVRTYNVNIEPAEEGGFIVSVPALPGCFTQGETYEEAVRNARECIEGFIEALTKAGEPIPEGVEQSRQVSVMVRLDSVARAL